MHGNEQLLRAKPLQRLGQFAQAGAASRMHRIDTHDAGA
jgi:hypothetical protein